MTDQIESPSYPWYESAEGDKLEQGDFIDHCRIFTPGYTLAHLVGDATEIEIDAQFFEIVIINQTCDLQSKIPLPYVVACPRWPYNQVLDKYPNFGNKGPFEEVRKGKNYRFCMLNKCDLPGLSCEIQIVDLAKVFFIPHDVMKQLALVKGERIRLRSPYKEKLAQAFAYYYMRVASPIDIADYDIVNQAETSTNPHSALSTGRIIDLFIERPQQS